MYTEHLRIPVGAGSLHIERVGRAGPAVVLLHGFGSCSFLWRAVAPRLADAGYTALSIDLMGHGESDRPIDASYSLAAQAEYVERALTALRLGQVTVVGQDMGALVALLLSSLRPERAFKLVLLEPLDPDDLPGPAIRLLQRTSALSALTANALFGALQVQTGVKAGLDPVLLAAANTSGGVLGKMISPQNLAIAASAVGMAGQEGLIFRKVIGYSLAMLVFMCVLVGLQATPVLDWMIPTP